MHKVEPGESLPMVAKRYGVAPAAIVAANNLKSGDALDVERLVIPAVSRTVAAAPVRTGSRTATRRAPTRTTTASAHAAATPARGTTVKRKPAATHKAPMVVARNGQ
jgi:LysM repeat protein